MKGGGSQTTRDKWHHIRQLMLSNKLDILAVQETHLSSNLAQEISTLFERQIHIISSPFPDNPNKAGVALILNKATTKWAETKTDIIVPGRAITIEIPWGEDIPLQCMAVYAPNAPTENRNFWTHITNECGKQSRLRPNMILGDFNLVEEAPDRSPPHPDNDRATEALAKLKRKLSLIDGWRSENPTKREYTFRTENNTIQSRIDRIYIKDELAPYATDWQINRTGIRTDHKLVSTALLNPWTPYIGKGRYAIPIKILEDADLILRLEQEGIKHQENLQRSLEMRTDQYNPQTEHKNFKNRILEIIRKASKRKTSNLQNKIDNMKKDMEESQNSTQNESEEQRRQAAILDEKIRELEEIKLARIRDTNAANFTLEGETITKYWVNLNKTRNPRDIVTALKDPGKNHTLERKSENMAAIAREYHVNLQQQDMPSPTRENDQDTDEVLNHIKVKISDEQALELEHPITKADVEEALSSLPNGKAAGLDGLVLELWTMLRARHDEHKDGNKDDDEPTFDVAEALKIVFNDIERHGVTKGTDFAEGWMCPLYKKGDKTDISNYRPITVLNADYKIYTKILTLKLTKIAQGIIHTDQAGFMVNRKITDQTELATQIIDWCEKTETNGTIVCLDQEKAYDKITHPFLWKSLKRFNFPDSFINKIKTLYEDAQTKIIINGEMSESYKIIRGVRQGDPLSCLLFNIAIESLAEMLRSSTLKGIRYGRQREKRLITTLFADDTTVYLNRKDSLETLQDILDKWCKASGAKFNVPKTVIIPVGTRRYRQRVIETRKTKGNLAQIPANIHIAKDGEPTRLLGAFIGNEVENGAIWTPTLEKIQQTLDRWEKSRPTLNGRRLIVGMMVGGMTQYKVAVQGMPPDIETKLERMIKTFIWGNTSRPTVNVQTLYLPKEEGGIGLLNVKARNEAIELMKAKSYLEPPERKPVWAEIADDLVEMSVTKKTKILDRMTFNNPLLQKININTQKNKTQLNPSLTRMFRTMKKHRVTFQPLLLTKKLRNKMPAWLHIGLANSTSMRHNATRTKCLRINHRVSTMKNLTKIIRAVDPRKNPRHKKRKNCACPYCKRTRQKGCTNPNACSEEARKWVNLLPPFWNPSTKLKGRRLWINENEEENEGENIKTFDPDITERKSIAEGFRVFCNTTSPLHLGLEDKILVNTGQGNDNPQSVVYTDGACEENGELEARAGAGIWYGDQDPRNKSLRVPQSLEQTNNTGEALAILYAVQKAPPNITLHIMTDSQITMNMLTKDLDRAEGTGWIGTANKELLQTLVSHLRIRNGSTKIEKVKGHSGIEGNEEADKLATEGLEKETADDINLIPIETLLKPGAQLSRMTQAILYKGILETSTPPHRRTTSTNIQRIKDDIKEINGTSPTTKRIWKSLENKQLTKKYRNFLWKAIHGAYKIGKYWNHISGFEERGECPNCGNTEDLDHILTQCEHGSQRKIWELTERLWAKTEKNWHPPTLGSILGSQLVNTENSRNERGLNKLYTIIMSESAYLIWNLRCEWRITRQSDPAKKHTEAEITNRWNKTLRDRIYMDYLTSDKERMGAKARDRKEVDDTWKHITPPSDETLDWRGMKGVLAGMGIT